MSKQKILGLVLTLLGLAIVGCIVHEIYKKQYVANNPIFEVGACVALKSHVERLSQPRDFWQREKSRLQWVERIVQKGRFSYRTLNYSFNINSYRQDSLEYSYNHIYVRVPCPPQLRFHKVML